MHPCLSCFLCIVGSLRVVLLLCGSLKLSVFLPVLSYFHLGNSDSVLCVNWWWMRHSNSTGTQHNSNRNNDVATHLFITSGRRARLTLKAGRCYIMTLRINYENLDLFRIIKTNLRKYPIAFNIVVVNVIAVAHPHCPFLVSRRTKTKHL